jgi:PAS domain S-box-containing protein
VLLGMVTLSSVVATIAIASFLNFRSQKQQLLEKVKVNAAMMIHFSEVVLDLGDLAGTDEVDAGFDSMLNDPAIMAMVIYDKEGRVFAYRSRKTFISFKPPIVQNEQILESDTSIEIFRSVTLATGETVGTVYLMHDKAEIYSRFKRLLQSGLIAGLLATGLSMLIALVLGRRIARPVEQLISVATEIGKQKNYSLRAVQMRDDEIGQLIRHFNDMLDRIETQNLELNQSQELLEQKIAERTRELDLSDRALNSAFNSVVITRVKDGQIIYCNEAMVKSCLWSREELLQHSMRILQGAETKSETVETLSGAISKGQDCKVTMLHYRKDGRTLWNDISIAPVLDASGRLTHFIWVLVDVTDSLAKEASLRAARDEAEKANKAKSEFLSRMSHELRTPLNSIIGFSKLLSMSGLTGKVEANINRIHQAGLHLLNLINEILDISRIETGNMSLSFEEIDLQEMLFEVVDLVRPMATDLKVTLVIHEHNTGDLKITADKQRLRQVLLNLASNGIKYNRVGGTLTMYYEQPTEDRIRIIIQNTGEGISESKLERLFQPFDRLDAEREHYQVEGTGLGLALSKKLTEAMGGKIWARSIKGKETQFFIELNHHSHPVSDQTGPKKTTIQTTSDTLQRENDGCVVALYVEDNPDNLALMEQVLEQLEGVRFMSAIQGRQGYDLARQHVPDVIFLDLNLSDIKGDKVLQMLKSDSVTKQIPVYILSADALTSQTKHLKAAGAVDYLLKPIDIPKFHAILENILESKKKATRPQV